jgi:hypothetical protein
MIFRTEKNKNYTTMCNIFFSDNQLTWKAKGILGYLLTKPDNWTIILENLVKQSKDTHR